MNEQMFSLHSMPKVSSRGKKRAGRGYGSGKGGHTSGRGQKGQKSRRTIPWSFEGGALPLSLRLPFWRGKGRLHTLKPDSAVVNIGDLDRLKEGAIVNAVLLVKEGFVTEKEVQVQGVKILGRGKLTKKLTISGVSISMPAKAKIEKAGGKVEATENEEPKSMLPTSRRLPASRSRGAQLQGSDVPVDFSRKKNQGSSEKKVKVTKKPVVTTITKKIAKKVTPKKKGTKKTPG